MVDEMVVLLPSNGGAEKLRGNSTVRTQPKVFAKSRRERAKQKTVKGSEALYTHTQEGED